jgi:hypothetical protein
LPQLDLTGVALKFSRALYIYSEIDAVNNQGHATNVDIAHQWNPLLIGHDVIYKGPALPKGLGVIVGDLVHNARSALDHLISALVLANGSKITRDHAFPICESPEKFEAMVIVPNSRGKDHPLKGLSNDQIEIIRLCQPFQEQPLESAEMRKSLSFLHSFSIIDKHQLIQSAGLMLIDNGVGISIPPHVPAKINKILWPKEIRDLIEVGDKLANVQVLADSARDPNVSLDLSVVIQTTLVFKDSEDKLISIANIVNALTQVGLIASVFQPSFAAYPWDHSYRSRQDQILKETAERGPDPVW